MHQCGIDLHSSASSSVLQPPATRAAATSPACSTPLTGHCIMPRPPGATGCAWPALGLQSTCEFRRAARLSVHCPAGSRVRGWPGSRPLLRRPCTGRTGCGSSWSRRLRRSSPRCWRRRARTGTRARSRRLSRRASRGTCPAPRPDRLTSAQPRPRGYGQANARRCRAAAPARRGILLVPPVRCARTAFRSTAHGGLPAWRAPSGRGARLPVPGRGPGRLPEFAHPVYAHLDRFPAGHTVAAGDALRRAGGTRPGRGDRRLRAEAGQVVTGARTPDGHRPRRALCRGCGVPGPPVTSPGPGRQTQRRPGASRRPRAPGPARPRWPRRCS